jgi:hypothetical protein
MCREKYAWVASFDSVGGELIGVFTSKKKAVDEIKHWIRAAHASPLKFVKSYSFSKEHVEITVKTENGRYGNVSIRRIHMNNGAMMVCFSRMVDRHYNAEVK